MPACQEPTGFSLFDWRAWLHPNGTNAQWQRQDVCEGKGDLQAGTDWKRLAQDWQIPHGRTTELCIHHSWWWVHMHQKKILWHSIITANELGCEYQRYLDSYHLLGTEQTPCQNDPAHHAQYCVWPKYPTITYSHSRVLVPPTPPLLCPTIPVTIVWLRSSPVLRLLLQQFCFCCTQTG